LALRGKPPFFIPFYFASQIFTSSHAFLQPSLSPAPTVDDINTSQREIYDTLSGARKGEQLRNQGNWVHVAVAAEAHVRATSAAAAGGERIIVRSGSFFYQDLRELNFSFRPILHDSGT
jgi:hypothetical protein